METFLDELPENIWENNFNDYIKENQAVLILKIRDLGLSKIKISCVQDILFLSKHNFLDLEHVSIHIEELHIQYLLCESWVMLINALENWFNTPRIKKGA